MSTIIVTDAETLRTLIAEEVSKALAASPSHQAAAAPLTTEEYLTVPEAAARLKISKDVVYRQIRGGELAASRVGRSLRVLGSGLNGPAKAVAL